MYSRKLAWATIIIILKKSMWVVILFYTIFVLQVRFNVLVGSIYENLGEDLDS